ncbi:STY0301 family protein [Roseateles sp. NT4]|uniref:STY0301 family protein n=1 Tax=Roseateles sp. NT4 TaxID=3453715 RepID=UPI003EEE0AEB
MNRLAVAFMTTFAFATCAEALEIRCPEKILTTQRLDKQEAGWQEFVRPNGDGGVDAYAYVSGISIYSDDPKLLQELKPDNETARDPSWSFIKPPPGTPPLHMACYYSQTRIEFVRALPANVKKCTAKRGGVLQCDVFKP